MFAAPRKSVRRSAIEAWNDVSRPARPILRELLIDGPRTRTALARSLGLSTGSLTRLTKPLVHAGLLVERGTVHDPVNGRPTRPLDIVADDYHFLGVKLTADRLYAVVTDLRARIVAEAEEPLPDTSPRAVCALIRRVKDRLARTAPPPAAAGITFGGSAVPPGACGAGSGTGYDAPFLGWRGVPLHAHLREAMDIPCVAGNDVAALAHSQHWFGAARGLDAFALVTVGAGIGYALFLHGRMVTVSEDDMREFAHHVLDPGGPLCPAGHRGCLSAYLATDCVLAAAATGLRRPATLEEIVRLAGEGDPACRHLTRQAGWAVGAVIATIANLTTVRTVIVTGESVPLARAASEDVGRGIAHRRLHDRASLDHTLLPAPFTQWARGGAVQAIRAFVLNEPDSGAAPTGRQSATGR